MGEVQNTFFEPDFNHSIKVHLTDDRITSNAGALLLREADCQLGLVESLSNRIVDPRNQAKIRYQVSELLRDESMRWLWDRGPNPVAAKMARKLGLGACLF